MANPPLTDRQRLAPLIRSTDQRSVIARMVIKNGWRSGAEIGVLKGKTMFSVLDACPQLHMIGVDQWKRLPLRNIDCAETYQQFDMEDLRAVVQRRADSYGERCRILCGDTVDMATHVVDESLDFVFIDGDHTLSGVMRDIDAWEPKVRPGGMVLGHDLSWPTVRSVIDKRFPQWVDYGEEVWGSLKS